MLSPGDRATIEWVVIGHANAAAEYGYPIELDVFVAPESEGFAPSDDEVALLVCNEWLEAHRGASGAASAGYARQYVDGTVVDRDEPETHSRIKSLEVQS